MLPTGLIIGVQKAGTTWIFEYLKQRGDVTLPASVKELYFFDRFYDRGIDWYRGHFQGANAHCIEVTPTYLNCPDAPARVLATLGRLPLVCVLREPVQRTWSLYLHMRRYGMTRLPFGAALDRHPILLESARYAPLLRQWFDVFGPDGVHVMIYEDLRSGPQGFADELCEVLGLPPRPIASRSLYRVNAAELPRSSLLAAVASKAAGHLRGRGLYRTVNAAKALGLKRLFFGGGSLDDVRLAGAERARLEAYFRPEVEDLRRLLGRPLAQWNIVGKTAE